MATGKAVNRRVIVHIGMHKTGSSSIQETLFTQLSDPAFEYADLGTANHSVKVFSLFDDSPATHHAHRKRGWKPERIERFNAETRDRISRGFQGSQTSTVIISGEDIGHLDEPALRRFKVFLEQYFADIVVVGYVRSPKSFMESAFQQRVKGSLGSLPFDRLYPRYRERFEKFDLVFGADKVQLWKFDPKRFPQGDVVLDFCQRLGIAMQPEAVRRVNESISIEALSLLFVYRKFGSGYGVGPHAMQENHRLINALRFIGSGKPRFAEEAVRPVLVANRQDLKWMEMRLGESLAEKAAEGEDDIRGEADLLRIRPSTVEALKDLLGKEYLPAGLEGNTPEEVAGLVHALREKLVKEHQLKQARLAEERRLRQEARKKAREAAREEEKKKAAEIQINAVELSEADKPDTPVVLSPLPDKRATGPIRAVLVRLGSHLARLWRKQVGPQRRD